MSDNCADCFYRIKVSGRPLCGYSLMTNEQRPSPAGGACTVKVPRKTYRRKREHAQAKHE